MIIFEKEYSDEDVPITIGDHILSAIDELSYTYPQNNDGFLSGKFKVTVEWTNNET